LALKILHLEDDDDDAELVAQSVRRDGLDCELVRADSRDSFIDALRRHRFDVILSDFRLPTYNGAAAMADAQQVQPQTPFVFVSGTAGEDVVVQCLQAGATDFVLKGQMARLGPAVRRALKEAEDRQARRMAEVTLADSLRFIQSIIDATPALVYVYDPGQGQNLFINHEALHSLGYSSDQLRAMGPDPLGRLMHPDDAEASRRTHAALLQEGPGGEAKEVEFRLRSARGAWRWFHAREVAFESGATRGAHQVLGAAQDVTAAKVAEMRRAAQYTVTRILADAASWREAMPAVLDALRRYCEAALAELWVVDEEAAVLRFECAAYPDPSLAEMWKQASQEVAYARGVGLPGLVWDTGQSYWGSALVRDGLSAREVLLGEDARRGAVAVPVRSQGTTGVIILFGLDPSMGDITLLTLLEAIGSQIGEFRERKRVEERVKEQAELLEHARDAIVVVDLNHRVTYWNKGAERLYGHGAADAMGRDAGRLFCGRTDIEWREARREVAASGEWTGLVDQRSRDGRWMKVQSHWTLVRDPAGQPRSILIINTDVTEAKRFESELLRAQRLDSLGVLAGGIAHDLNNVLAPILMALDSLRRKATDERSRRMFQLLEASASRGADLVRQILAFARGVEGQRLLLEPPEILRDLEKMLRDALPTSIQLVLEVPGQLWALRADPTQLHQVLLNLCVNGRDAMASGGVLGVSVANAEIDAAFARMNPDARPGSYVMFKVSDTGAGIPPDVLDRIFEPFFTTKESGRGTGLGLSTSMTIVKGHQGFVRVVSEVGRGSTFSVYLPATRAEQARALPVPRLLPHQGHGEVILVVDDEGAIREITKETLEASGYGVVTAADGAEAVGIGASRHDIAAVLMDIHMPVMDGAAATRALLRINPQTRVVAVSGYSARETQVSSAGARWFLAKPYTAEQLLAKLREALDTPA
jgi:two-component system cell cycle sensor histidine kinase/response regulator CckA